MFDFIFRKYDEHVTSEQLLLVLTELKPAFQALADRAKDLERRCDVLEQEYLNKDENIRRI